MDDLIDDSVAPRHRARRLDEHDTPAPQILELDPLADARWDAYVRGHPQGSVYHLAAWAPNLERAYGFRPRYLGLAAGDSLTGVLPLFRKKGIVSDARLRSIPVFSYGGPLGDDALAETRLIEAARDLGVADKEIAGTTINTGERRLDPPAGFVVRRSCRAGPSTSRRTWRSCEPAGARAPTTCSAA